ncbi:hypothetical protein F4604DRAFT_1785857 [Suillus subluteus]|nr:hypothetical protein F4604DRAFT_1785857 [Suillus subluteus]
MFLLLSVLMVRVLTLLCPCLFCIIVMCRVLFVIMMAWLWNRVLVRCVFLLSTVGIILGRHFTPLIVIGSCL